MYVDFLTDPKIVGLAFEDQRHFIGILALKSDGQLDQGADTKMLDRIVAQRLWIDSAVIKEVKSRLLKAGLIDPEWQPKGWEQRQFRSDKDPTGAQRQRAFKARKAAEVTVLRGESNALPNAPVTVLGNDKVTHLEQIQIQNRTDTEQKRLTALGVCLLLEAKGIENPSAEDPELLELIDQGVPIGEFASAGVIAAKQGKPRLGYVLGVVKNKREAAGMIAKDHETPGGKAWYDTSGGLEEKARSLGLAIGESEAYPDFRYRVFVTIDPRGEGEPSIGKSWPEWQKAVALRAGDSQAAA